MPRIRDLKYIELLAKALRSPPGIKTRTADAERLRQKLYRVRTKHPEYKTLTFSILPSGELAILSLETPDASPQE